MGKIPSIKTSIAKLSDGDASIQYNNAGNGVRDNAYFLTPDVPCIKYDAEGADFVVKAASKPKTTEKTALKKAARLIINKNYKTQALYVIRICNGNIVMLNSSNFVRTEDGVPRANPDFTAKNGQNPGDVIFTSKKVKGAKSYLVESRLVSDTAPNEWATCKVLGKHTGTKSGFVSGLVYEFRMKVIYSTTEGAFYESVTLRIL